MTNRERRRLNVILKRAEVLQARLSAGLCTKLDAENQELSALQWAISVLVSATGLDIDLDKCGVAQLG